jgi:hypothetical protein
LSLVKTTSVLPSRRSSRSVSSRRPGFGVELLDHVAVQAAALRPANSGVVKSGTCGIECAR